MRIPPQLDDSASWKARFRAPTVVASDIASLAPSRGLVATNASGTIQWYAWDVLSGDLRQLTDTPGGHANQVLLSPDGRWVYYLQDHGGNEIGHYVRIPFDGGAAQDVTPDLPPYSSSYCGFSRSGNRMGFTTADSQGFHLYCIDIDAEGNLGKRREIYSSTSIAFGPALSYHGDVAVVMSSERTGKPQFDLLSFAVETGEALATRQDGDEGSLQFAASPPLPHDDRFLVLSQSSGIERPLLWNARSGESTELPVHGLPGAVLVFDWSDDGEQVLLNTLADAQQQIYLLNLPTQQISRLQTGPGAIRAAYFRPDSAEILAHWEDPTQPSRIIALDAQSGRTLRTVLAAGEVPAGQPWRSVTFASGDGQTIQAWLAVPPGKGPFPVIFHTHGGPHGVTRDTFAPSAQCWLDHGFVFVSVNYRGSTTFGRDFQQQIWGRPGELEMEDMLAARAWLLAEGIADPDAILLTGASYGGYLTLLGLGQHPDRWAGGMAVVPITDWAAMYADEAETLRGFHRSLFGGDPEQTPEQHRRSSPITYVEDVRAPVLILQGRNDTRTPARPVEMYEARMPALGKDIYVHWYDTGHAGSHTSVEEGIRQQELMLRFAYRVLG